MVNKNVIRSRAEQIDNHIEKLSSYSHLSFDEFICEWKIQDIVEYNLFQIVNHIIDMVEHIVVDEKYGMPETSYDSMQLIYDNQVIDSNDLDELKRMIGFRNVVGHEYIKIDKDIVFKILSEKLPEINKIISKIIGKFL